MTLKYKKTPYGYDVFKDGNKVAKISRSGGWHVLFGDDETGFESVDMGYTLNHAKDKVESKLIG